MWWATLAFTFRRPKDLRAPELFKGSSLRRALGLALAVLTIAAGAAIGFVAGHRAAVRPLSPVVLGTQTVHRGALQTAVPIPPLKP